MENTRKGKMDVRQIVARPYVLLTKAPSSKLRRYVTLTQDVVVWLLGYSLKKNVDNLHYFVLFNNGPWYNVILTIKKEKYAIL